MYKVRLKIFSEEEFDQSNKQNLLDKEIEEQGVLIGWKAAGVSTQINNLKNQTIVRYKNTKVMRFEKGNLLLCNQDGCYSPTINNKETCSFHNKGGETSKFCKSNTLCILNPKFGYEKNKPLFCKTHSSKDMIDVRNKKCKFPGCNTQPQFGIVGEKADFCVKHKTEEMVDIRHKKCVFPECGERARYEYLGETTPRYCFEHRLPDMLDVEKIKCSYEGCRILPLYGLEDETLRYCKAHKSPEMKNLGSKKCLFLGCELKPAFGYEGGTTKFCKKHMDINMVNVYNRKCLFEDCKKLPSFGFPGEKCLYCYKHKLAGMKDVKNKKCISSECEIQATFGYRNDKLLYCHSHKLVGMINLRDKRCITIGCDSRSTCGYLFTKTNNHCLEHSTLNEYNKATRFPKCSLLTCFNSAKYINYEDESFQPIRCIDHKQETDIEIIEKVCSLCSIKVYIPENKDICAECGGYRCKIIIQKEHDIKLFLKSHDIKFINNKPVHLDGSSKRPDFLIDAAFGKIVLECDEFQHKGYDNIKEQNRMKIIYKDIQILSKGSEVLFVRYNPDNYKGVQYNSIDRLQYLHFLLNHIMKLDKININLGVIYLFYNGFDDNPQIQQIKID